MANRLSREPQFKAICHRRLATSCPAEDWQTIKELERLAEEFTAVKVEVEMPAPAGGVAIAGRPICSGSEFRVAVRRVHPLFAAGPRHPSAILALARDDRSATNIACLVGEVLDQVAKRPSLCRCDPVAPLGNATNWRAAVMRMKCEVHTIERKPCYVR